MKGLFVSLLKRIGSKIKKDLYDANAVDDESKTSHDDIDTNPQ